MQYCQKCGKGIVNGASFCSYCGSLVTEAGNASINSNENDEKIVMEVKGTLVGGGQGKVILTNKHIMWTKSATNFLLGGIMALATKGSTSVAISDILSAETGSGLGITFIKILANNGKKYKFGFNKKAERDQALSYLKNINRNIS